MRAFHAGRLQNARKHIKSPETSRHRKFQKPLPDLIRGGAEPMAEEMPKDDRNE